MAERTKTVKYEILTDARQTSATIKQIVRELEALQKSGAYSYDSTNLINSLKNIREETVKTAAQIRGMSDLTDKELKGLAKGMVSNLSAEFEELSKFTGTVPKSLMLETTKMFGSLRGSVTNATQVAKQKIIDTVQYDIAHEMDPKQYFEAVKRYSKAAVIALDSESKLIESFNNQQKYQIRSLQLHTTGQKPLLIDLEKMSNDMLAPLKSLLGEGGPMKIIHNAPHDIAQILEGLSNSLGLTFEELKKSKFYDTLLAARTTIPYQAKNGIITQEQAIKGASALGTVVPNLLHEPINKELQGANWGAPNLTETQYKYMALDAEKLIRLKAVLEGIIQREGLQQEYQDRFNFVLQEVELKLKGASEAAIKWAREAYYLSKNIPEMSDNKLLSQIPYEDLGRMQIGIEAIKNREGTLSHIASDTGSSIDKDIISFFNQLQLRIEGVLNNASLATKAYKTGQNPEEFKAAALQNWQEYQNMIKPENLRSVLNSGFGLSDVDFKRWLPLLNEQRVLLNSSDGKAVNSLTNAYQVVNAAVLGVEHAFEEIRLKAKPYEAIMQTAQIAAKPVSDLANFKDIQKKVLPKNTLGDLNRKPDDRITAMLEETTAEFVTDMIEQRIAGYRHLAEQTLAKPQVTSKEFFGSTQDGGAVSRYLKNIQQTLKDQLIRYQSELVGVAQSEKHGADTAEVEAKKQQIYKEMANMVLEFENVLVKVAHGLQPYLQTVDTNLANQLKVQMGYINMINAKIKEDSKMGALPANLKFYREQIIEARSAIAQTLLGGAMKEVTPEVVQGLIGSVNKQALTTELLRRNGSDAWLLNARDQLGWFSRNPVGDVQQMWRSAPIPKTREGITGRQDLINTQIEQVQKHISDIEEVGTNPKTLEELREHLGKLRVESVRLTNALKVFDERIAGVNKVVPSVVDQLLTSEKGITYPELKNKLYQQQQAGLTGIRDITAAKASAQSKGNTDLVAALQKELQNEAKQLEQIEAAMREVSQIIQLGNRRTSAGYGTESQIRERIAELKQSVIGYTETIAKLRLDGDVAAQQAIIDFTQKREAANRLLIEEQAKLLVGEKLNNNALNVRAKQAYSQMQTIPIEDIVVSDMLQQFKSLSEELKDTPIGQTKKYQDLVKNMIESLKQRLNESLSAVERSTIEAHIDAFSSELGTGSNLSKLNARLTGIADQLVGLKGQRRENAERSQILEGQIAQGGDQTYIDGLIAEKHALDQLIISQTAEINTLQKRFQALRSDKSTDSQLSEYGILKAQAREATAALEQLIIAERDAAAGRAGRTAATTEDMQQAIAAESVKAKMLQIVDLRKQQNLLADALKGTETSNLKILQDQIRALKNRAAAVMQGQGEYGAMSYVDRMKTVMKINKDAAGLVDQQQMLRNLGMDEKSLGKAGEKAGNAYQRGFVRSVVRWAVAIGSMSFMIQMVENQIESLVAPGLKFDETLQQAQVGLAGIINSLSRVNGEAITWTQSMAVSEMLIDKMSLAAAKTGQQTQDLVGLTQALMGSGLAAQMSTDQIVNFATVGSAAVKQLGLPASQLVTELRDIVQGGIRPANSTLGVALGLTDADVQRMKAAGNLYEVVMERMQGFSEGIAVTLDTVQGKTGLIREGLTRVSAEGFKPIFNIINQIESQIIQKLIPDLKNMEFNKDLIKDLKDFARTTVNIIQQFINLGKTVKGIFDSFAGLPLVTSFLKTFGTLISNNVASLTVMLGLYAAFHRSFNNILAPEKAKDPLTGEIIVKNTAYDTAIKEMRKKRDQLTALFTLPAVEGHLDTAGVAARRAGANQIGQASAEVTAAITGVPMGSTGAINAAEKSASKLSTTWKNLATVMKTSTINTATIAIMGMANMLDRAAKSAVALSWSFVKLTGKTALGLLISVIVMFLGEKLMSMFNNQFGGTDLNDLDIPQIQSRKNYTEYIDKYGTKQGDVNETEVEYKSIQDRRKALETAYSKMEINSDTYIEELTKCLQAEDQIFIDLANKRLEQLQDEVNQLIDKQNDTLQFGEYADSYSKLSSKEQADLEAKKKLIEDTKKQIDAARKRSDDANKDAAAMVKLAAKYQQLDPQQMQGLREAEMKYWESRADDAIKIAKAQIDLMRSKLEQQNSNFQLTVNEYYQKRSELEDKLYQLQMKELDNKRDAIEKQRTLLKQSGPVDSALNSSISQIDNFMAAIAKIETGGKADPYHTYNDEGSGAFGKYQFMPERWHDESMESLGYEADIQDPKMQERIAREAMLRAFQRSGQWSDVAYSWNHDQKYVGDVMQAFQQNVAAGLTKGGLFNNALGKTTTSQQDRTIIEGLRSIVRDLSKYSAIKDASKDIELGNQELSIDAQKQVIDLEYQKNKEELDQSRQKALVDIKVSTLQLFEQLQSMSNNLSNMNLADDLEKGLSPEQFTKNVNLFMKDGFKAFDNLSFGLDAILDNKVKPDFEKFMEQYAHILREIPEEVRPEVINAMQKFFYLQELTAAWQKQKEQVDAIVDSTMNAFSRYTSSLGEGATYEDVAPRLIGMFDTVIAASERYRAQFEKIKATTKDPAAITSAWNAYIGELEKLTTAFNNSALAAEEFKRDMATARLENSVLSPEEKAVAQADISRDYKANARRLVEQQINETTELVNVFQASVISRLATGDFEGAQQDMAVVRLLKSQNNKLALQKEQLRENINDIVITFANLNLRLSANGLFTAATDAISQGLDDIATQTKTVSAAFRDMAYNILRYIEQIVEKMLATRIAKNLFNMFGIQFSEGGQVSTDNASRSSSGTSGPQTGLRPLFNAGGGRISGPGTGTSDSILSWLSNGEFVVKAAAVQQYGVGFLERLNRSMIPKTVLPRFAAGGLVNTGSTAVSQAVAGGNTGAIEVNVNNHSGTPVQGKAQATWDNEMQKVVISIMLDAVSRNVMSTRDVLTGLTRR